MPRARASVLAAVLIAGALTLGCSGDGGGGEGAGQGAPAPSTTTGGASKVEKQKPAAGKGNVQGLVLYDDQPVPAIEVLLCSEFAQFGSGCGGDQHKATTGDDGTFVIADVPPFEYEALLVRVFDSDQYQFAQSGFVSAQTYRVDADKTLFVDTTHLFRSDLRLVSPASGSQVPPANLEVRWEPYPKAAHYRLSLIPSEMSVSSPVNGQRVDGTTFSAPAALAPGKYRVKLEAFSAKDRKLAEVPSDVSFQVVG